MRKHFFLLISIIICISMISGNNPVVDAAKLKDKPPEPVGSWTKSIMMGSVCKPLDVDVDGSAGNHGRVVCWDGTDHGRVEMGIPNLIVSGPFPNYGLVGVPVVYKYEWEDYSSIPVDKVHDEIYSINGTRERYNGLVLYVRIEAQPKFDGNMNGYGNLEFKNIQGQDVFGILGNNSMPNGTLWDEAIGMTVEGWRTTGGSMGAFQLVGDELRTEASIQSSLGVSPGFGGVSDSRRWPDNMPYYNLYYGPEYFFGVTAMASSTQGSGIRRSTGEPAFQVGINQYWKVYARLKWDSIDRWVTWTEEECHMEPDIYPWLPEIEVCEDVKHSDWLVADVNPYDSRWQIVLDETGPRKKFVDNTSDGGGRIGTELNIDYYQSQPLLSED